MDFSVAICTYNRATLLPATFETLEKMAIPPGATWEVVIINNNSTDDTSTVIERFRGRLPVREVFEPRQGIAVARNRALAECRGDKILWTDDDVHVDPKWAVALLRGFDTYAADVVFGRSYPVWTGAAPRWFGHPLMGLFACLDYGPKPFEVTDLRRVFFNLNVGFNRRVLTDVGGYREDLGHIGKQGGGGEDTDMFERIVAAGLRVVYEPAAVIGHCISPHRATKRCQRQLAWQGAYTYYRLVAGSGWTGPAWRGIPRHMFRMALDDTFRMAGAWVSRNPSEAFYREMRVLRFLGLVRQALSAGTKVLPREDISGAAGESPGTPGAARPAQNTAPR